MGGSNLGIHFINCSIGSDRTEYKTVVGRGQLWTVIHRISSERIPVPPVNEGLREEGWGVKGQEPEANNLIKLNTTPTFGLQEKGNGLGG